MYRSVGTSGTRFSDRGRRTYHSHSRSSPSSPSRTLVSSTLLYTRKLTHQVVNAAPAISHEATACSFTRLIGGVS